MIVSPINFSFLTPHISIGGCSNPIYGETFECYPLGLISLLNISSTVFSGSGTASLSTFGVRTIEGINYYPSGSSPSLNSGSGWSQTGSIT